MDHCRWTSGTGVTTCTASQHLSRRAPSPQGWPLPRTDWHRFWNSVFLPWVGINTRVEFRCQSSPTGRDWVWDFVASWALACLLSCPTYHLSSQMSLGSPSVLILYPIVFFWGSWPKTIIKYHWDKNYSHAYESLIHLGCHANFKIK